MDTRSKASRSQIMAAVHSRDTGPEMLVRRFLWSRGVRYRVHAVNVPGTPDVTVRRHKLAIFIHGCFWHGHEGCPRGKLPKSRLRYWKPKIDANKRRDTNIAEELNRKGWHHLIVWECQIRTKKGALTALPQLLNEIHMLCPGIALR